MITENVWKKLRPKECLAYPYKPQHNVIPAFNDMFGRNHSRLLASLTKLANKFLNDKASERSSDETVDVSQIMRICSDRLNPADLNFLITLPEALRTKASIILTQSLLEENESIGWQLIHQAIFIHCFSETNYAVYFVTLNEANVDVYTVGDCDYKDLQDFGLELIAFFEKVLPSLSLSFRVRLQVPSTFYQDPLWIAFLLAVQLHRRGKYLDLDGARMIEYKLKALQPFKRVHDRWLGQLNVENIDSEIFPYMDLEEIATNPFEELINEGWALIDNIGHGTCGYYALLLGLENNGETKYRAPSDNSSVDWQDKVLGFRRDLRNHSRVLLNKHYKIGEEPGDWWFLMGAFNKKDRKELSLSFFDPTVSKASFFADELDAKYHMFALWGSLVFSSLFQMRVVLIMRDLQGSTSWNTTIFDCTKPLKSKKRVVQIDGIHRISDDDFKNVPTVEIFYTTGDGPPHYQLLRRVYCDDVSAEIASRPTTPKLLDVVKIKLAKEKAARKASETAEMIQANEPIPNEKRRQSTHQPVTEGDSAETGQIDEHSVDAMSTEGATDSNEAIEAVIEGRPEQPQEEVLETNVSDLNPPANIFKELDDSSSEASTEQSVGEVHQTEEVLETNETDSNARANIDKQLDDSSSEASTEQSVGEVHQTEEVLETNETDSNARANIDKQLDDSSSEASTEQSEGEVHQTKLTQPDEVQRPLEKRVDSIEDGATARLDDNLQQDPKLVSRKKRSAKVLKSKPQEIQGGPSKQPRLRRAAAFKHLDEKYFDDAYWAGSLKHKTPARMKYDTVAETFWICLVDGSTFTPAKSQNNVDDYDERLINQARNRPDEWVGCSLGDPGDDEAPSSLQTRVRTIYQQHIQRFCLTQCLASALFYCGFTHGASIIDSQKRVFALLPFDEALQRLKDLMSNLVPLIGRATIYNQKKNRNKKMHNKPRPITWEILFSELVPHPTLVIPVGPEGLPSHAFCVVDDLIFDSTTPYALKLQRESVNWLFNDREVEIYQALRFNMKCSPKGVKVDDQYRREVTLNWDHPARVFVQRTSKTWNLPHYVIE